MLGLLLIVPVATLGLDTLHDATEARYGDIVRVMPEAGKWLFPQNVPGDPFWAKLPLNIWAGAGLMATLGVNEFWARLPSVLFIVAAGKVGADWARGLVLRRAAPPDRHAAGFLVVARRVAASAKLVEANICYGGLGLKTGLLRAPRPEPGPEGPLVPSFPCV